MITLAEINRITLRQWQPVLEQELRALGIRLPIPWQPSDEELSKYAAAFGEACRVYEVSA